MHGAQDDRTGAKIEYLTGEFERAISRQERYYGEGPPGDDSCRFRQAQLKSISTLFGQVSSMILATTDPLLLRYCQGVIDEGVNNIIANRPPYPKLMIDRLQQVIRELAVFPEHDLEEDTVRVAFLKALVVAAKIGTGKNSEIPPSQLKKKWIEEAMVHQEEPNQALTDMSELCASIVGTTREDIFRAAITHSVILESQNCKSYADAAQVPGPTKTGLGSETAFMQAPGSSASGVGVPGIEGGQSAHELQVIKALLLAGKIRPEDCFLLADPKAVATFARKIEGDLERANLELLRQRRAVTAALRKLLEKNPNGDYIVPQFLVAFADAVDPAKGRPAVLPGCFGCQSDIGVLLSTAIRLSTPGYQKCRSGMPNLAAMQAVGRWFGEQSELSGSISAISTDLSKSTHQTPLDGVMWGVDQTHKCYSTRLTEDDLRFDRGLFGRGAPIYLPKGFRIPLHAPGAGKKPLVVDPIYPSGVLAHALSTVIDFLEDGEAEKKTQPRTDFARQLLDTLRKGIDQPYVFTAPPGSGKSVTSILTAVIAATTGGCVYWMHPATQGPKKSILHIFGRNQDEKDPDGVMRYTKDSLVDKLLQFSGLNEGGELPGLAYLSGDVPHGVGIRTGQSGIGTYGSVRYRVQILKEKPDLIVIDEPHDSTRRDEIMAFMNWCLEQGILAIGTTATPQPMYGVAPECIIGDVSDRVVKFDKTVTSFVSAISMVTSAEILPTQVSREERAQEGYPPDVPLYAPIIVLVGSRGEAQRERENAPTLVTTFEISGHSSPEETHAALQLHTEKVIVFTTPFIKLADLRASIIVISSLYPEFAVTPGGETFIWNVKCPEWLKYQLRQRAGRGGTGSGYYAGAPLRSIYIAVQRGIEYPSMPTGDPYKLGYSAGSSPVPVELRLHRAPMFIPQARSFLLGYDLGISHKRRVDEWPQGVNEQRRHLPIDTRDPLTLFIAVVIWEGLISGTPSRLLTSGAPEEAPGPAIDLETIRFWVSAGWINKPSEFLRWVFTNRHRFMWANRGWYDALLLGAAAIGENSLVDWTSVARMMKHCVYVRVDEEYLSLTGYPLSDDECAIAARYQSSHILKIQTSKVPGHTPQGLFMIPLDGLTGVGPLSESREAEAQEYSSPGEIEFNHAGYTQVGGATEGILDQLLALCTTKGCEEAKLELTGSQKQGMSLARRGTSGLLGCLRPKVAELTWALLQTNTDDRNDLLSVLSIRKSHWVRGFNLRFLYLCLELAANFIGATVQKEKTIISLSYYRIAAIDGCRVSSTTGGDDELTLTEHTLLDIVDPNRDPEHRLRKLHQVFSRVLGKTAPSISALQVLKDTELFLDDMTYEELEEYRKTAHPDQVRSKGMISELFQQVGCYDNNSQFSLVPKFAPVLGGHGLSALTGCLFLEPGYGYEWGMNTWRSRLEREHSTVCQQLAAVLAARYAPELVQRGYSVIRFHQEEVESVTLAPIHLIGVSVEQTHHLVNQITNQDRPPSHGSYMTGEFELLPCSPGIAAKWRAVEAACGGKFRNPPTRVRSRLASPLEVTNAVSSKTRRVRSEIEAGTAGALSRGDRLFGEYLQMQSSANQAPRWFIGLQRASQGEAPERTPVELRVLEEAAIAMINGDITARPDVLDFSRDHCMTTLLRWYDLRLMTQNRVNYQPRIMTLLRNHTSEAHIQLIFSEPLKGLRRLRDIPSVPVQLVMKVMLQMVGLFPPWMWDVRRPVNGLTVFSEMTPGRASLQIQVKIINGLTREGGKVDPNMYSPSNPEARQWFSAVAERRKRGYLGWLRAQVRSRETGRSLN
jgi:hypothetical protein